LPLRLSVAAGVGAALALPTCYHLFGVGGGGTTFHRSWLLHILVVAANFLILLPVALAGVRRAGYRAGIHLAALAIAALLLLVLVMVVRLPEGNEHNLSNAAQCLLAVPAGALFAGAGKRARAAALLLVAFLPTTACTLLAFASRPPLPLSTDGGTLKRIGEPNGLEEFYDWVRRATSRESVFIIDPDSPVKMSGNVSEFPAFTARTLFTDMPGYLTTPNRDAPLRAQIAGQAVRGESLSREQRDYISRLQRPVYVVSYHAGDETLTSRLAALYGAPVFHGGIVAVFEFAGQGR